MRRDYTAALLQLTWCERIKQYCFSAYITVEAYIAPQRSKRRWKKLVGLR